MYFSRGRPGQINEWACDPLFADKLAKFADLIPLHDPKPFLRLKF